MSHSSNLKMLNIECFFLISTYILTDIYFKEITVFLEKKRNYDLKVVVTAESTLFKGVFL